MLAFLGLNNEVTFRTTVAVHMFHYFLRLASCDAPHKGLLPLWRCSGEYLDSLLMLALESSGQDVSTSAAAWTLHVVLIHDWWEKRLHCLLTHDRLLQKIV